MGIVVPLVLKPRSMQTSGNSQACGHRGSGTHHLGFPPHLSRGESSRAMAAAAQCARLGTGRSHLSLCGAGWSKDSDWSRSPGIPRSGHGGPGWATARTTFCGFRSRLRPRGGNKGPGTPPPVALVFRLAGGCAFGFGIPFPAACT